MVGTCKQPNRSGNNNLHVLSRLYGHTDSYGKFKQFLPLISSQHKTHCKKNQNHLLNYTRLITPKQFKVELRGPLPLTGCVRLLRPSTTWWHSFITTPYVPIWNWYLNGCNRSTIWSTCCLCLLCVWVWSTRSTTVQAGRSRVRVPMSLNYFKLPNLFLLHNGPGVYCNSNENEYQEIRGGGVKGAGA
jgi:hypothetical protein